MTNVPDERSASDPLGLKHLAKFGDAAASVINNIINHVSNAIGISYDDLLIVARAKRQAAAKLLTTKADVDAEAYRRSTLARVDHEITAETALDDDRIEMRARRRVVATAVRDQENIEAITVSAIEHVIDQSGEGMNVAIPTAEPTPDWMAEFIDLCKNATDVQMRKLWGRVLAGEIQRPGSFSIRSLLALKTLLPSEATIFQKACNLLLDRSWIYDGNDDALLDPTPLTHYESLVLSSAGLINSEISYLTRASTPRRVDDRRGCIIYDPYQLHFRLRKKSALQSLKVRRFFSSFFLLSFPEIRSRTLTKVGEELSSLIKVTHDWNYVRTFISTAPLEDWEFMGVAISDGYPAPPEDLTPP